MNAEALNYYPEPRNNSSLPIPIEIHPRYENHKKNSELKGTILFPPTHPIPLKRSLTLVGSQTWQERVREEINTIIKDIKILFPKEKNLEKKATKNEIVSKEATVSPFFDLQKSITLYRKLIELYGEEKGSELAKQTFIKDVDSQLWELRETANSYQYRLHMVNGRLVHESDLHNGTPLIDGVTDKIRRGKEKEQMQLLEQMLKNLPIGSTILIPSPKLYERDETKAEAPYPDSILTRITRINEHTYQGLQTMSKMEAPEMVKHLNNLAGRQVLDPNAHIDQILLTLVQINGEVSDLKVIQSMEKITGVRILTKSPEHYMAEEQKFAQFAKIGGEKLFQWIQQGLGGEALDRNYSQMMAEFLKGVQSSKVHHDEDGRTWFESSCGSFGEGISSLFRTGIRLIESASQEKMWCTSEECKKENTCIGKEKLCNFCGSKLTDKKP